MENIFITIVCIALIILGGVSYAASALNSVDKLTVSWKTAEAYAQETRETDVKAISSETYDSGSNIAISLENNGNQSLVNFNKWDVIVRYQDGGATWIPYTTSTPGWSISGIFYNGQSEVYEPNIFNPSETMTINIRLSSGVSANTTNLATISTYNGIHSQIPFGW
jgi:archaellum component FlaF (FlaF/FlaG flagellin family)